VQQLVQALDYRLALLKAAQRELFKLQQERLEDPQRDLSRAAIEALASLVPGFDTSVSSKSSSNP
jgi:hypothetical protein